MLIYIYVDVSVNWPLNVLCVFVCVISNRSTCKKPPYVSDLSKLDALLHTQQGPSGTKVPRLDMCRSAISLSKTTRQIWHHYPFSKRNLATKKAVGVEVGDKTRWFG